MSLLKKAGNVIWVHTMHIDGEVSATCSFGLFKSQRRTSLKNRVFILLFREQYIMLEEVAFSFRCFKSFSVKNVRMPSRLALFFEKFMLVNIVGSTPLIRGFSPSFTRNWLLKVFELSGGC